MDKKENIFPKFMFLGFIEVHRSHPSVYDHALSTALLQNWGMLVVEGVIMLTYGVLFASGHFSCRHQYNLTVYDLLCPSMHSKKKILWWVQINNYVHEALCSARGMTVKSYVRLMI